MKKLRKTLRRWRRQLSVAFAKMRRKSNKPNPKKRMNPVRAIILIINLVVFAVGLAIIITDHSLTTPISIAGLITTALSIGYFVTSFRQVELGTMAVATFGGEPIHESGSGWQYIPPIACSLEELPTQAFSLVYGVPEDGRVDGIENTMVFRAPAFRITFADLDSSDHTKEEKKMLRSTNNQTLQSMITADPTTVLVFKIKKGHATQFVEAVESIPNAMFQLEHVVQGFLQEVVEKKTAAWARANTSSISKDLKKHVEDLVNDPANDWGVDVVSCRISTWGFPRRINEALADLSKSIAKALEAAQKKLADIEDYKAQAEKKRLDGLAEVEVDKAKAEFAESEGGQFLLLVEAWNEGMKDLAGGKGTMTLLAPSEDMGMASMMAKFQQFAKSFGAAKSDASGAETDEEKKAKKTKTKGKEGN